MRTNAFSAVQSLTKRFGAAAGLSHTVRCGVQALWQVDAGVAVAEAVRLIGSRDTSITQDQNILATALRRLLSSDHLAEGKALLAHLNSVRHPVVQTKFFIMATAAAVPRPDMWQVTFPSFIVPFRRHLSNFSANSLLFCLSFLGWLQRPSAQRSTASAVRNMSS